MLPLIHETGPTSTAARPEPSLFYPHATCLSPVPIVLSNFRCLLAKLRPSKFTACFLKHVTTVGNGASAERNVPPCPLIYETGPTSTAASPEPSLFYPQATCLSPVPIALSNLLVSAGKTAA